MTNEQRIARLAQIEVETKTANDEQLEKLYWETTILINEEESYDELDLS